MTFPNPNFDHQELKFKVKNIVDSHGKPSYAIEDKETRALRDQTIGGIEIKKYEIPFMQHMLIERINNLDKQIGVLQASIDSFAVANLENAREELENLKKEDNYLKHNFAEKFFK